jgi:hypothetical protein
MATFGLKVVGGGSPLSEIFKNAFGDPTQKAQLDNISSEIWAREYANKANEQQAENYRQAAAKTAQEAAILKAQQAAKDAYGPAFGEQLAGHVAPVSMPVPVTLPAVSGGAFAGAAPGIVQPENYAARSKQRELDVAAERLRGPAIVQMASNSGDLAQGSAYGLGSSMLDQPATPDDARRAMLLMGKDPTTTTVTSSADNIGVDAATRQAVQTAAGKLPSEITLAREKATAEAEAARAANPLGTAGAGPAATTIARLKAKAAQLPPGQKLSPEDEALLKAAQADFTKEASTVVSKDATLQTPNIDTGKVEQTAGPTPGSTGDQSIFAGTGTADEANNIVSTIATKMRDKTFKPTGQGATDYAHGYFINYMNPRTSFETATADDLPNGIHAGDRIQVTRFLAIPPGTPTPEEVYARAGVVMPTAGVRPADAVVRLGPGDPANPTVVPPAAAAAVSSPAVQVYSTGGASADVAGPAAQYMVPDTPAGKTFVTKIASGSGIQPTATEIADRTYAGRALYATAYLNNMNPKDIPTILEHYFADPSNKGVLLPQYISSHYSGDVKNVLINEYAFLTAVLRRESGAAINVDEYRGYSSVFLPQPNDGPEQVKVHMGQRMTWLRSVIEGAYATDQAGLRQAKALAKEYNVDLDTSPPVLPTGSQKDAVQAGGAPPKTFRDGSPARPPPPGEDPDIWYNTTSDADRLVLETLAKRKAAKAAQPAGQPAIVRP